MSFKAYSGKRTVTASSDNRTIGTNKPQCNNQAASLPPVEMRTVMDSANKNSRKSFSVMYVPSPLFAFYVQILRSLEVSTPG